MKIVSIYRQCRNTVTLFNNCRRNYARHIPSDNVVNLNKNTLTGRLLIYFKSQETEIYNKTENFDKIDAVNLLRKGTLDMEQLSTSDLKNVIGSLENKEILKSDREFYKILKFVDQKSCYRNLQPLEILNILDAYMDLVPHRVTELKFYKNAMDQLFSMKDKLDKKNNLKFIFYISLMKRCVKAQKILRQTLSSLTNEDINCLTSEELRVIANSTFKTSTRISNKNILHKIKNYLNDNLMLLKDPAIFITLIKTLRHNRYFDEDLLASISCAIFFNKSFECYTFQTYCHLLALYSDNLYYDDKLFEFLTKKCVEELKFYSSNKCGSEQIRGKDIVRFLWGMSNLNSTHLEKADIKNVIVPNIMEKINSSELDVKSVVDVLLHLWILNYRCYELIPYILSKKDILKEILHNRNSNQRLNQLLTCIYHEDRPLFKEINIRPQGNTNFSPSQHLKDRPYLQNVLRSLKTVGPRMNLKFEVGYQIPYMNILGITGYKKNIHKSVNVEVLDHFTTLKNTESTPSGLMQMKLRILDGSEEALIVVKQSEIEYLTEAELEQFFQDELELVC